MSKIALVIIFNHQYNENIEILENIYRERFSYIFHLVPFYSGEKKNVIPIYENSYNFQGYLAQGFRDYFRKEFEHYFFIGDDLILNPIINQDNYKLLFKLKNSSSFLPGFISLHNMNLGKGWWRWPRVSEAYNFKINDPSVEIKKQLPSYEKALQSFNKFGLELKPLKYQQIWKTPENFKEWRKMYHDEKSFKLIYNTIKKLHFNGEYELSYPLVGSYSDILIVSSENIKEFCHYCGVFAAARLFVEIALPTALILSAEDIITEKDLEFQGKALWPNGVGRLTGDMSLAYGDENELEHYNYSLNSLLNNFPPNYIYLHPIKLSKWKNNL